MNLSKHLNTCHFYPHCILQQVAPRVHLEEAYLPVLLETCCLLGSLETLFFKKETLFFNYLTFLCNSGFQMLFYYISLSTRYH